ALPAQPLLSHYAVVPGGLPPTLLGMLALAVACVSLAYGLATADPRATAATRVLLLAAAAGLMLSALFPTDPPGTELKWLAGRVLESPFRTGPPGTGLKSLAGEIDRGPAAGVLTTLSVAGWTLARRRARMAGWTAVRALAVTAALVLALFLAAHPVSITSAWI